MSILQQIAGLELVKARFRLEFTEPLRLAPEMLLRWRRELHRAARSAPGGLDTIFQELLDPRPAVDPYARRHYQKPSPLFVIEPLLTPARNVDAGDQIELEVLFPGAGVAHCVTFLRLLSRLGEIGFYRGEGRFEVVALDGLTHQDNWQPAWTQGRPLDAVTLPLLNLQWLIEEQVASSPPLLLQMRTQARLLRQNRPLFRADLKALVPYALRRVTSLLHACYQVELQVEPAQLLSEVAIDTGGQVLTWQDWRRLETDDGDQELGGLLGSLWLHTPLSDDLLAILCLAGLFHVGKGGSYGCGSFTVSAAGTQG